MANLRYQQQWLQQTEKGVFTSEKQQRCSYYIAWWLALTLVLLLIFLHLSRASEAGLLSRVFRAKLFEPMSRMGEFFLRLENSADSMGTPCVFYRGRLA